MTDINDIKIEDLQDSTRFTEFQAAVVEAIEEDRARDALDFRLKIQQFFREYADLENTNPDLFKNYRKIILYIELELFELLPEDLQVVLLEKYFHSFAQLNLDVVRKMELAIVLTDDVLQNDKRDTFMAALLKNQHVIGRQKIELQGKMVTPTIGNWVAKYRQKYGLELRDELVQMDFCSRDEARNLSDQERVELQRVLEAVEMSKIQPEEYAPEDTVEDETPKTEAQRAFSALDVPVKQPKVPISEVQKIYPNLVPAQQNSLKQKLAPQQNVESPAQHYSGFRSLADLGGVNIDTAAELGISLQDFCERIKMEAQKVYMRSPQSKPHIVELWHQSPLYQVYNAMAEDSMRMQQPIDVVERTRREQGQPALSREEFHLIADLSTSLQ